MKKEPMAIYVVPAKQCYFGDVIIPRITGIILVSIFVLALWQMSQMGLTEIASAISGKGNDLLFLSIPILFMLILVGAKQAGRLFKKK